jgi:hypothetical protein
MSVFILPLVLSLLNSGITGVQSFTAYLGFTIFSAICGLGLLAIRRKPRGVVSIPPHIWMFLLMTASVFVHGLIMNSITFSHFYWIAASVWLLSLHIVLGTGASPDGNTKERKKSTWRPHDVLLAGVAVLAFLESLIVVFQVAGLLPSKNDSFPATGTWVNPNITAMFLAFSIPALYGVLQSRPQNKKYTFILFALVLLAIILLQSRTAYVVALLMLAGGHPAAVRRMGTKAGVIGACSALVLFILFLAFAFKAGSTEGRLNVWKNSISLISEQPLSGSGFGSFEKAYNMFISSGPDAPVEQERNDHVNMAYNDFLELGVEGGIWFIAVWMAYLASLFVKCIRNRGSFLSIPIVLSFIIVQLLNFGFQAIPVFVLFLLYTILPGNQGAPAAQGRAVERGTVLPARALVPVFSVLSLVFLVYQLLQAKDILRLEKAPQLSSREARLEVYSSLNSLDGYYRYHELVGDEHSRSKDFRMAVNEYRKAVENCSHPGLLFKCGVSYQKLNRFDSSNYYFQLLCRMQPYKFTPQFALLKLYEQSGDTLKVMEQAQYISTMPMRVPGREVFGMRSYARQVLKKRNRQLPNQHIKPVL